MARIAITSAAKCNLLAAKVPLLGTWFIRFFDNDVTPDDNTTRADLFEASNAKAVPAGFFLGIDRPAWGPCSMRDDGFAVMSSQNMDVLKRAVGPPLLLYGWFFVDESNNLKMAQRFAGILPKVVDPPLLTFTFRIDLLEGSIP